MNRWLLQSKLTPPSAPTGWLARALLPAGTPLPPLTVLQAGPGYGKTLGLLALVQPLFDRQAPVAWLSLDAYDTDPANFFHYLAAAMAPHVPQLGAELGALLTGERQDPRLLWQCFFGAIAAYNVPEVALVLDDVHHLTDAQPEVIKALAYFFDKLPPGVHVLLSTRKRLPVPLGRLLGRHLARVLEPEQLRFQPDEVTAFLAAHAGEGGVPAAWTQQAAQLDGWPLGLAFAIGGAELEWDQAGGIDAMTAYVAEELYAAQDDARRDFMLKAALLQELTPEACRWIFQALDAADQLEALEADHLVQRLGDGTTYRFPAYLQEVLTAEGKRTISAIAFKDWHRRAANYYQDEGREELALPHLIASEDWAGALWACDMSFPAMRFNGRQKQIERWLAAFPPELADTEPRLALWQGHVRSRGGAITEALEFYDRALALFKDAEDTRGEFKVLVRLFTLALLRHDAAKAAALMPQTLSRVAFGDPEDVVDLHLARALAADRRGDMGLVRECNEEALALPIGESIEIAASHYIARSNLYTLALHKGHLREAFRHIERSLEIAEAWKFHPYHLVAAFLRADLRLTEGDVEEAGRWVKSLPGYWADLLDWHDQAVAYAVLGGYHQAKGEWKEAEEALARSLAIFTEADYDIGKKVPLERLMGLALARKQYGRADELKAQCGTVDLNNIYDLAVMIPYARCLHLQGRSEEAVAELERVIPALEAIDAPLHLARARLFEAAARRKTDEAGARDALAQAMGLIEQNEYRFLLTQDQVLWEELAALRPGPESQVPGPTSEPDVIERVVPAAPEPEPGTWDSGPGTPLNGLSIHSFGGFEVRLDGLLLDQWPRRKAKLILAALLLHPRGMRLADLAEYLGAEEFSPTVQRTYQSDLSALRRSLEPNLAKGDSSRFLKLVDDRYMIAWDQVSFLDTRAFEQAVTRGNQVKESDPSAAAGHYEVALGHYRGPFLEDGLFMGLFEGPREQFRRQAVELMLWLYQHHQDAPEKAEGVLKRAIELEPCEEEIYIALMKHYQAQGRPVMVRKTYFDCRKALKSHLGAAPSDILEKAYKAIA